VTHDDRVLLSSEVGVLSELPDSIVRTKARLEPGKMFLVDFDKVPPSLLPSLFPSLPPSLPPSSPPGLTFYFLLVLRDLPLPPSLPPSLQGEIVPDGVIKEEVSAHFPYGEWLNKNLFSLDDWTAHSKATGIIPPPYNLAER